MSKTLVWINPIGRLLNPLLRCPGFSQRLSMVWVTAAGFGLAFGAAVMVAEAKEDHRSKQDPGELHLLVGGHHSVIENPILFVSMGLNLLWIVVPRLILTIRVIRLYRLW
jgi:hypothetical protein